MNIKTTSLDECLAFFCTDKESIQGGVEFNGNRDTKYAHDIQSFSNVIHIFSMEWKGIRSAVGAMSGGKLAITANRNLGSEEIQFALRNINKFSKAVFHGLSPSGRTLIEHIHRHGGPECHVVWHGNHAQLSLDSERELFLAAMRLYKKGFIRRMHLLRGGCHLLLNSWQEILFNAPLNIEGRQNLRQISENGVALVPITAEVRKNLYTNIIAAVVSKKIKTIKTYNGNDLVEICRGKNVKFLPHDGLDGHLAELGKCDISLNVTCIDCQPMVDIEALSVGTPAITGPLFLENHFRSMYPKLTTVHNPLSSEEIVKAIDRLDDIPVDELRTMMSEYKAELLQKHIESFEKFLA